MMKTPLELKKYYQERYTKSGRVLDKMSTDLQWQSSSRPTNSQSYKYRLDAWKMAFDAKPNSYPTQFLGLKNAFVVLKPTYVENQAFACLVEQSECSDIGNMIFSEGKSELITEERDLLSFDALKWFLSNAFVIERDLDKILSEIFDGLILPEPKIKTVKGGAPRPILDKEFPQRPLEPTKKEFGLESDDVLSFFANWWKRNENLENYQQVITSYDNYLEKWEKTKTLYDKLSDEIVQERSSYQTAVDHLDEVNNTSIRNFQKHKSAHADFVKAEVGGIQSIISDYKNVDGADVARVVETYFELIYRLSPQPKIFPRNLEIHFDPESAILMCSLELPNFNHLPLHKVVQGKTKILNQSEKKEAFEYGLYATWLRVAHEFAKADTANIISKICINGWVTYIDNADGHTKTVSKGLKAL